MGALRTARRFVARPLKIQSQLLRSLLKRAAPTEWGRRFGFTDLARSTDVVSAYQAGVPLHGYGDIELDVKRMRASAADVLWPGVIRHFAVSSGTTSFGKIIPVSRDMLLKNKRFSTGVALQYLSTRRKPGFLLGRHLGLPGRIEQDPAYPGTLAGEISGLQTLFAPALYRHMLQAIPSEVAFLPNWDRKLNAVADRTLDMDVRMVAMAPTWGVVLFKLLIEKFYTKHGRTAATVGEVWPHLQLFISGGVALSSYRDILQDLIGKHDLDFLETYGASEGFFSYQTDLDDPAMLLHLDNGVFFEFIRLEELGERAPRRYTIADVETDVRYAPFLTTCSGLWAYGLGDVVRFTSTSPHKILVAGRTAEMMDGYGEAVFGEDARQAIEFACQATEARFLDYHVAPRMLTRDRHPAHQWLVEFEREPHDDDAFIRALDSRLCEINRHYQIRREAHAFDPPELARLPPGTFRAWLGATRNAVSVQTKVPRMSEGRTLADGILAIASAAGAYRGSVLD